MEFPAAAADEIFAANVSLITGSGDYLLVLNRLSQRIRFFDC
jgi:hypothetical protein